MAVMANQCSPPRLSLPPGAAARRVSAQTVLEVLLAANDGVPAAQHLFPYLPRVLLRRGVPVADCIAELVGRIVAPPRDGRDGGDPMTVFCRRLRDAVADRNLRAVLQILDRGPSDRYRADAEVAKSVISEKFPQKGGYPGGPSAERDAIGLLSSIVGKTSPRVDARALVAWARAKRRRAGDAGGWSGRLILELVAVEPLIASEMARLISTDPLQWRSPAGAAASWRLLRGGFVPQPGKPLPRPIAVPPLARRVWAATAIRAVQLDADDYCRRAGQYGLSPAGGQLAYGLVARATVAIGGDLVIRDKANSFHEFTRESVVRGTRRFVEALVPERRETSGAVMVEVLKRTFAGSSEGESGLLPWPRYVFGRPDVPDVINGALCQGSPESSLVEALTYAASPQPSLRRAVSLELHDDGFTAALPDSQDSVFDVRPSDDGSRFALQKWIAIGPRAEMLVESDKAGQVRRFGAVCGVPVGDDQMFLAEWREGYQRRLERIREVAAIDAGLAGAIAMTLRGPGALAIHLLRAIPPAEDVLGFWRERDREWVELWLDIAGVPGDRRGSLGPHVTDRVFLRKGAAGAGAVPAAEVACQYHAAGLASALPFLQEIFRPMGLEPNRRLWTVLGAEGWHGDGEAGWTYDDLIRATKTAIEGAKREVERCDEERHARVHSDVRQVVGPRDAASGAPNLFMQWMRSPPPAGTRYQLGVADPLIGVRRALGLPAYGMGMGPSIPPDCRACGAVTRNEGVPESFTRPQKAVDEYGEHALTCPRGAVALRRHNAVCTAVRRCAEMADLLPSISNRSVVDRGYTRPADVYLGRHPGHAGGMAIDVTVVSRWANMLEKAEDEKRRKYATYLGQSPTLGFCPFALDLTGGIGPAAWAEIRTWARSTAERPDRMTDFPTALNDCVADISWTFVDEVTRQIRSGADAGFRRLW